VTINYSVDLRLVSDIVGVPMDELIALNPSLLRLVTPPDAPFDLHLPAGTATLFQQRIAEIPENKRNAWRYHRVTTEETLAAVAREYHVSESELAAANQLSAGDSLRGVEALVVPVAPAAAPTHMLLYVARKGDTLVTIADRFGVSLNQLRRWNRIAGIQVKPGRRLHVADPSTSRAASHSYRRRGSRSGSKTGKAAPAKEKSRAHTSGASSGAKKSGAAGARKSRVRNRTAASISSAGK
jgi:membrane-bound lytic murein transglycosylase D